MLAAKCDSLSYEIEVSSPEATLCVSNNDAHMSEGNCQGRQTGKTTYTIENPKFFTFVTVLSNSDQTITIRQKLANSTLKYNSTSFVKVYTHELCHAINYFKPPESSEPLLIT